MQSKIMLIAAFGLLLGACGEDEGIETEPLSGEPAVGTERDRMTPEQTPATSPAGMPATGTARPAAMPTDDGFDEAAAGARVTAAVVRLEPTEGNSVQGDVRFEMASAGIQSAEMDGTGIGISGTIEGLPAGEHGFHVHEFGDCSAPDASSAGDHFNPEGHPHGGPDEASRHVGDLGNLEASEGSPVTLDMRDDRIALSGAHSIIGRALVVHADADDLESQPSGEAGARMACGVIGIAATEAGAAGETGAQPPGTPGEISDPDATPESDSMTPEAPTDEQTEPPAAEPPGT